MDLIIELKAKVYDQIAIKEEAEREIARLNQEILRLAQESKDKK